MAGQDLDLVTAIETTQFRGAQVVRAVTDANAAVADPEPLGALRGRSCRCLGRGLLVLLGLLRIDLLLVSAPVAARLVDAEIDRDARKGPPVPSDHAPLLIDLDEAGRPLKVDWAGALSRIAARTR